MSENVISFGVMAALKNPVGDMNTDTWADAIDYLDEFGLAINYEGTIIYQSGETEEGKILFSDSLEYLRFNTLLGGVGVEIDDPIRWFCVTWYYGTDSPMDDITLEQFKKQV